MALGKNLDRERTLSCELEKAIKAALSSIVTFVIPEYKVDTYKQKVQEEKSIRFNKILENPNREYGIIYEDITERVYENHGGIDFQL